MQVGAVTYRGVGGQRGWPGNRGMALSKSGVDIVGKGGKPGNAGPGGTGGESLIKRLNNDGEAEDWDVGHEMVRAGPPVRISLHACT